MSANYEDFSDLVSALGKRDYTLLEQLLAEKKMDINVKDQQGTTLLKHASKEGCPGMVDYLLKKGANVNITDNKGYTPLMTASLFGNCEVIMKLLNAGADATIVNEDDSTAYMIAMIGNQTRAANLVKTNTESPQKLRELASVLRMFGRSL
jgi:ankyrin repeat protein